MNGTLRIAYFTMEIGLGSHIPTYSGGLGVLAGDTVKSAADLELPLVAVTLLSRKGYFRQELAPDGSQIEHPVEWEPAGQLQLLPNRVSVSIEGRKVLVQAWLYNVQSLAGTTVPVYFLDTDIEGNAPDDRGLTDHLYGGDSGYRLKQEIILGIGGLRMLRELDISVYKYHLNEGHSALLTLDLLQWTRRDIREVWDEKLTWDVEAVRERCIFTTHTPIEAGHDKFPYDLVEATLDKDVPMEILRELAGPDHLNMTLLALNLSNFVNGVAKKHGEVSRQMFRGYHIHSITNGIHPYTWACDPMKKVFDKYIRGWANEPELFVRADAIPDEEIWNAHMEAKGSLVEKIRELAGTAFSPDIFTIGFARRATSYKRANLLFSDMERLVELGSGKLQIVYAGKAHPRDEPGKEMIREIFRHASTLRGRIEVVYLPDYCIELAADLVSGVDLWLNTPLRPMEASGTSGMKTALNGVPNFSVLDGWWIEGHIEGVTGWSIGPDPTGRQNGNDSAADADDLYRKLEKTILPLFYEDRSGWIKVMKNAISKNAYYFNSHRMMRRYVTNAYITTHQRPVDLPVAGGEPLS